MDLYFEYIRRDDISKEEKLSVNLLPYTVLARGILVRTEYYDEHGFYLYNMNEEKEVKDQVVDTVRTSSLYSYRVIKNEVNIFKEHIKKWRNLLRFLKKN